MVVYEDEDRKKLKTWMRGMGESYLPFTSLGFIFEEEMKKITPYENHLGLNS